MKKATVLVTALLMSISILVNSPTASAKEKTPDYTIVPDPFPLPKPIMPDRFWVIIANCETGYALDHSTLNYTSALGIARGTWGNFNPTMSATTHNGKNVRSWKYQKWVAENIAFRGYQNDRQNRWVWRVGPWGWACLKARPEAQQILCRSKKPIVQRWKRNC